jgi:hypothetical protein
MVMQDNLISWCCKDVAAISGQWVDVCFRLDWRDTCTEHFASPVAPAAFYRCLQREVIRRPCVVAQFDAWSLLGTSPVADKFTYFCYSRNDEAMSPPNGFDSSQKSKED